MIEIRKKQTSKDSKIFYGDLIEYKDSLFMVVQVKCGILKLVSIDQDTGNRLNDTEFEYDLTLSELKNLFKFDEARLIKKQDYNMIIEY